MIYAITVYYYLGPKLGLVVRKCLASLGIKNSGAKWSSIFKSISEVKVYSDWKYNEFLPLVMLALSRPEEAFQWLLSQPLRYIFLWNMWEWTGRTGSINFSLASPSPSLFLLLILVWWYLERTSQFYVPTGLIVVRNILRVMNRHSGDKCFLQRS